MARDIESPANERADALRHLMVATVNATPFQRPRAKTKLIFAAVGAFAVAGALTGGALTTAALTTVDPSAPYIFVSAEGHNSAEGRLVGSPVMTSGSGDTALTLGKAPEGASHVVIAYDCTDRKFEITVTGKRAETNCSQTSPKNPRSFEMTVADKKNPVIEINSSSSKSYVVWASWSKPVAQKSPQQKLELIDGVITRDEYLASFNRMVGCMTAGGYQFDVPPETTTVLQYVTDENNDGYFTAVCYPREFQTVDTTWQIQNELAACLTSHSITPQASIDAMKEQLTNADIDIRTCPN